jgi:capsid portal protein
MGKAPFAVATDDGKILSFDLLGRYAAKDERSDSRALMTDAFQGLYMQYGLISPPHNLDVLASLPEANTYHKRCCATKSMDIAGLGYGFSPIKEEASQEQKDKIDLLFKDNGGHEDSVSRVFTDCWYDAEVTGNLGLEIVREDYDPLGPVALFARVKAHQIRVHKSGEKFCQMVGVKRRWFKQYGLPVDVHLDTGEIHPIGSLPPEKRATEIIWIKLSTMRSSFYGTPDIIPALGAITGSIFLRDYNIDFFRHFGIPSYAVYITGDYDLGRRLRISLEADGTGTLGEEYIIDDPGMTATCFEYEIISTVKRHLESIRNNPHTPLIMAIPSGKLGGKVEIEFKPLAVETKDAHFRLYRKDNRDEVLVAHGIPPYRIGVTETGSLGGSTAVESTNIYKTSIVAPRQVAFEEAINRVLRETLEITDWEFYFEEIDVSEEKNDRDTAGFLFERGGITPNELINYFGTRFGIEPSDDPAMDYHYINGQAVETGQTSESVLGSVKELHQRLIQIAEKDNE